MVRTSPEMTMTKEWMQPENGYAFIINRPIEHEGLYSKFEYLAVRKLEGAIEAGIIWTQNLDNALCFFDWHSADAFHHYVNRKYVFTDIGHNVGIISKIKLSNK